LAASSALALGVPALAAPSKSQKAPAPDDVLDENLVLRDPALPVGGNPKGDISIVEWLDYNCPSCRAVVPTLRKVVSDDGKLRMIVKDWPILGEGSTYAARLALATRFQGKYLAAHDALMTTTTRMTESTARERVASAGVDIDRALADLDKRKDEIDAILKRNDDQAKAFGFEATPSFIIGKFRVPGVLSAENFKLAIADARKAAKASKPGRQI
jgi:protein-disulfide isomerase